MSRVLAKAPTATRRAVTVVAQTFSNAADYDKILKVCTCQHCRPTMQIGGPLLASDVVPMPACCGSGRHERRCAFLVAAGSGSMLSMTQFVAGDEQVAPWGAR